MNKAIFLGRFVKDPELKQATISVCNFTLAVNRRFKKEGEDRKADFPQFVAFNKTAEFITKWFKKGSQVVIESRVQTRTYEKDDGTKVYVTEFIVDNIDFAEGKRDNASASTPAAATVGDEEGGFFPVEDDDLPF